MISEDSEDPRTCQYTWEGGGSFHKKQDYDLCEVPFTNPSFLKGDRSIDSTDAIVGTIGTVPYTQTMNQ